MSSANGVAHGGLPADPVPLGLLFVTFLKISMFGAGGGIAWAHQIAVEQRRWMGEEEFADILALCQFLPGPNVVGIAVCVGANLRGAAGAFAATCGFLLIPWTVGFAFGLFCLRNAQFAIVQHVLAGVSAAGAGLLIATGVRIIMPHRRRLGALATAGLAFSGIVFTKLPLLIVLAGVALFGFAVVMVSRARAK